MDSTRGSKANDAAYYLKAGVAVISAIWGIYSVFSGTGDKKMKAPGQPGVYISRNAFEKNPSSYFRDLHKK